MERAWAANMGTVRKQADRWITLALGFASLFLYLFTLCPTVYLGDSGEISTAIALNGVIHAPGYPLFSLLGRFALMVVPLGEPAFRIGCMVAAAAAGSVGVLYLLIREMHCSRWAALCGAVVFGTSYGFWSQSVRVEVYTLHVLLVGLALLSGFRYRRTGAFSWLVLAASAISLGLAHHLTIIWTIPALLLLGARTLWQDPRRVSRVFILAGLMLIGPLLYGFLILWTHGDTIQVWGYTVDLPSLWNHARARQYSHYLKLPTGPRILNSLELAGQFYMDSLWYAWMLPPIGVVALWRRCRTRAGALLLFAGILTAFNFCYTITDISGYYLPVWLTAGVFTAVALDALHAWLPRELTRRPVLAAAVFLLLVAAPVQRNWQTCNLSQSTWVREFARQKLEHCAPNAVLFTEGDSDTFPVWYVHHVLGVRPDVLPLDRRLISSSWINYHRAPSMWYLHRLRRMGLNVSADPPRSEAERDAKGKDGYVIDLLKGPLRDRPLAFTYSRHQGFPGDGKSPLLRWVEAKHRMVSMGMTLAARPKSEPVTPEQLLAENQRLWRDVKLPEFTQTRTDQELDPLYVKAYYAKMLSHYARLYELAGKPEQAMKAYEVALSVYPDYRTAIRALKALRRKSSKQG